MFDAFAQITWIDYVGSFGTLMVVLAYFLTQLRMMSATDLAFPIINLIGSVLIGASLYFNFNLASALIEFFWIIISIFGIVMWLRDNLNKKDTSNEQMD
ncbi:CBU_0592 family membrane protein [Maritalea sp.]|uniref:CBU_0592 family membrane protein n=1 Tax=Maritalea sp. TaxID=2003361 RepID=UPI003EFACEA0